MTGYIIPDSMTTTHNMDNTHTNKTSRAPHQHLINHRHYLPTSGHQKCHEHSVLEGHYRDHRHKQPYGHKGPHGPQTNPHSWTSRTLRPWCRSWSLTLYRLCAIPRQKGLDSAPLPVSNVYFTGKIYPDMRKYLRMWMSRPLYVGPFKHWQTIMYFLVLLCVYTGRKK